MDRTFTPEHLESRIVLSASAGVDVGVASSGPPIVVGAYLSNSGWTDAFKASLAAAFSRASAQHGYGLEASEGSHPPPPPVGIGWLNIDRVTLLFNSPMALEPGDLRIWGVADREHEVIGMVDAPEGIRSVVTWTLAVPVRADKLLLDLDGDPGTGAVTINGALLDGDYNGQAGGDFRRRIDILPGDSGGSGIVGGFHLLSTRQLSRFGNAQPFYSPFYDFNGDGVINAIDVATVRRWQGARLPAGEPLPDPTASAASTPALRTRPVSRGLFGVAPILLM